MVVDCNHKEKNVPNLKQESYRMYHKHIWLAIDKIAQQNKLTCSALACRVGLDSTLFNPSKRYSREGKPHIPSFNTIMKLVYTLGLNLSDFEKMMFESDSVPPVDTQV